METHVRGKCLVLGPMGLLKNPNAVKSSSDKKTLLVDDFEVAAGDVVTNKYLRGSARAKNPTEAEQWHKEYEMDSFDMASAVAKEYSIRHPGVRYDILETKCVFQAVQADPVVETLHFKNE